MKIGIGTKFRYSYADSNPLWKVVEKRGRGTWIAEVVEGPDWLGQRKAFASEEINGSHKMAEFWKKSSDDSDVFYASLKPGSIVHYSNGHNAYIRCQVMGDQLLPIALVGNWFEHELPTRQKDGSVYFGYHGQQIQNKTTFRPHASNVWEYNLTKPKNQQVIGFNKEIDPRQLVPLSLEVPLMTPQEALESAKHVKLSLLHSILKSNDKPDDIFLRLKNALDDKAL